MKYFAILLVAISIASCGTDNTEIGSEEKSEIFKVEYKGALKNMMHKGDVSAKVTLTNFENTENFYALGALENRLKVKFKYLIQQALFNTIVVDSNLTFDNSFSKKATLLVYASVSKWKSINIPDNILTYEQLESYVHKMAKENQIKTDEPFPFLIEGKAKSFDWHVINWKDRDKEHSHEKHINSGLHGTINDRAVKMLGFYSDSHHAIFTHHTTNMHIHVKTDDNEIAGHVDGLSLGKGMILKLPEIE